ncbi:MAG: BTAD domain-containing putative transcriptional regulator, partial [Ramlibacter sp.]
LAFAPAQARVHLERAYAAFTAAGDLAGRCFAWCALVDSLVFEWGNFKPLAHWLAEMEPLVGPCRELPGPLDAEVACGMFLATMYARPQHPDMAHWEQRVRAVILHGGNPRLQVKVGNHLLIYYTWWIGDLAKAELLVNTLRAQIADPGVAPLLRITWDTMAAAYFWMSAKNGDCVACVDHGLQTAQSTGVHTWDMLLCSQGVFASLSSDDAVAGARYLQRMETLLNTSRPMDQAMYYYLSAWFRVMQGNLPGAREFAETAVAMATEAGADFPAAVMRIDLGRVRMHQGDDPGALALVRQARADGRTMHAQTIEYLSFMTDAEIALHIGDEALCVQSLRQGLRVGAAQQFRNQTWWLPSVMARLYAKALGHGIEVPYVTAVIRERRLVPPADAAGLDHWPWPLQIRTLGEFVVLKDGEPMRFTGKAPRKPLELLKALIASGGSDVNQEFLTDALWPDLEGAHAQQAFETALYRLRKLFAEETPFLLKDGRLTLDASAVHVDIWDLERLLDATDEALRTRVLTPGELDDRLRRLSALYGGHFLAQETAPWALPLRERLRSRFLRAIEELGRRLEAQHDRAGAIQCYQRGLEVEPIAEALYLRLMCCHQALGQPAEALAVYRRCRRAMGTLLGVPPSREIEAVLASLTRQSGLSVDP